ncbi:type III-B CRISPR module RAMP protein Cmr6 [Thauera aromatica]|nr:type III-B CRISPR module RAMP protein Cmr6 [Thauera aromatica]MCK2127762.1 type III-B CRISPR module RAMP protein Cmr6 [Thauera aromatica]
MTLALPDYLGNNARFDDCPPGHRFGLYFDGWTDSFALPRDGKTGLFRKVANALPAHSRAALDALCRRQRTLADGLGDTVFSHPARLTAPLSTGLGNEHPLENGFAFLTPHGLPYLAGSGVKGVIRRAAEELVSGEWGGSAGWTKGAIRILFGPGEDDPERDTHARRGALMFWDLFFRPADERRPLLSVEIMTPHHTDYLQKNSTPHANGQPNPIPFLAVAAGCECTLYVQCHPALIPADAAALRNDWQNLLAAAIEHAGDWLGFGAKTAVGYGRIGIDPKVQAARAARHEAEAAQRRAQEAEAALAGMPPDQQLLNRLDARLASLPTDPRKETPILQLTSGKDWLPTLELIDAHVAPLADLAKPRREALASEIRKRLGAHFKVEGKADKAMKERLAAVRGG